MGVKLNVAQQLIKQMTDNGSDPIHNLEALGTATSHDDCVGWEFIPNEKDGSTLFLAKFCDSSILRVAFTVTK